MNAFLRFAEELRRRAERASWMKGDTMQTIADVAEEIGRGELDTPGGRQYREARDKMGS